MLDFAPGTNTKYSNYGYLLAGAVVEHVTGQKYFDYVKNTLLQPAGITEVQVISSLSPIDLASALLVPAVYGGDGEINEVGDPNDGTGASAQALVQFIHLHAVWGNGPRAADYARSGSTPGASSLAVSRGDNTDWAYVINTRDWPPSTAPTLNDLGNSITQLLNTTPLP